MGKGQNLGKTDPKKRHKNINDIYVGQRKRHR